MPGSAFNPQFDFPLGGPPPNPLAAQAVTDLLGVDILFTEQGLVLGSNGDYIEVAGVENLRRAVIRRLITKPGEYRPFPRYGVGIGTYVKRTMNTSRLAELKHLIIDNLSQEKRIDKVLDVTLTPGMFGPNADQPGLTASIRVQAIARELRFEHSTFRQEVG
jgi:hypothetical protein